MSQLDSHFLSSRRPPLATATVWNVFMPMALCCIICGWMAALCPPVHAAAQVRIDPQYIAEQNLAIERRLAEQGNSAGDLPDTPQAMAKLIAPHLEKARRMGRV